MKKISFEGGNSFCPQALYLYGTYKPDGRANYGLFCWASYAALGDVTKFVACIGEDKLTRDLIRKNRVFSATVVTEALLARADFCGCTPGEAVDKSRIIPSERGEKLDVPIPTDGQWTLELRVDDILHPEGREDSDIYICSIVSVRADERLASDLTIDGKMNALKPIVTLDGQYFAVEPTSLGAWGDPMKSLN